MCKTCVHTLDVWTSFTSLPTYPTQDHNTTVQSVGEKVCGRESSLSKPSISPRNGSSYESLCLTFLFSRCTSIYNLILNISTVFGGALNQTALVAFFWHCFKINLIQPSETSLLHSCLQRASAQWGNYWRAAHKRWSWCAALCKSTSAWESI